MRLGIDLGGSKIELVVLADDDTVLLRERVATPAGEYAGTLQAIAALLAAAPAKVSFGGTAPANWAALPVGIGIPGAEAADGRIKNANSTCLNTRPLRRDLERLLARPVRLANDANCFALSEAHDGAAQGAQSVFGAILGTGVGGGIVIAQQLHRGVNAIAGEWGHNPMPGERAGLPCYCGRYDCVETWLSGPALVADHARSLPAGCAAPPLDAARIAAQAEAGDAACAASLARYEQRLARALAGIINVLDPEVIVLGGGLSNIARLYLNVPRLWAAQVFSDTIHTRLVQARHGDSSGVLGAARLFP